MEIPDAQNSYDRKLVNSLIYRHPFSETNIRYDSLPYYLLQILWSNIYIYMRTLAISN